MALNSLFHSEIRTHQLFNSLSDESFQLIAHNSGLISLKKNEILFECSYEANYFFLVRTGQITYYQHSLDGNEKIINIFEPNQTFAEACMFNESKYYPVNARATCNTEVFYFDLDKFKSQLYLSRDTCFAMMTVMSNRLKAQTQEIVALSIHDAQYRLVNYLLQKSCDQNGQFCQSVVKLSSTKSLLASRLSITPETFSRILSRLKKQDLISIKDDLITLKEPGKLRELIGFCSGTIQEKIEMQQASGFTG
ncbi:MAG: Crp/Fnr family transcriptional regulator [gamma proteobacterium symbiont of Lucinoma myriamae]|nr:Crp/Fnr family transcriptional regulator [gamma proteobacterium symbiont of Lucinoma myriamae]MCU7819071.1 Crp/Fnr family transcriptional regulator [gamma proteobacterium symbiont of Lucinoma myriamae]MCU7832475.1 Crp/Fnr family transcriptional regulator [gamma proteobacterium symbiont of Lucinoma myriamae]